MCILILFILATLISHLNEEIFNFLFSSESNLFFQLFKLFNSNCNFSNVRNKFLFHFGNPSSGKFKLINAGTIFSTFVIIIASAGCRFILKFHVYNKIYGSIGSLLISLVWLNIVSYVLMIGFELYAKIDEIKNKFIKS